MKDTPRCRHLLAETTTDARPYAVATVNVIPWSIRECRSEADGSRQFYLCEACHSAMLDTFKEPER